MEDKTSINLPSLQSCTIAIIGLGYVGLPLAIEFSKCKKSHQSGKSQNRNIIGYDTNLKRVEQLKKGYDKTNEVSYEELKKNNRINFTCDPITLDEADVYIITVPTPIDSFNKPDLKYLISASQVVGNSIKRKSNHSQNHTTNIIIYESTVYPGVTEEICIPIIEDYSKSKINKDFYVGYSPERVNPGDKEHNLSSITKIVSGSKDIATTWINNLYASIIKGGTFKAKNIKTAEAAKIIENVQRDINIALVNELAIICEKIGINCLDVLKAAETKWNFLPFRPGLVGGHCISVDPYYLTYKAEELKYNAQIILSGRRINEQMSKWISEQIIIEIVKRKFSLNKSKVLFCGMTFKENCPDLRNTRIKDLYILLKNFGIIVEVYDPWASKEILDEWGIKSYDERPKTKQYCAIIGLVAHEIYKGIQINEWKSLLVKNGFYYDLKGIFPKELNAIYI